MKGAPKQAENTAWGSRDACPRAGDARRVAGEKMIHGLLGVEARDRRQNAESVAGQHHDVSGSCTASRGCVWDEVQRISDLCVFGFRLVVEVDASRRGVERDILRTAPKRCAAA